MESRVLEKGESVAVVSGLELAVVVSTFNERDNISPLLDRLEVALAGLSWEVIVVDGNRSDVLVEVHSGFYLHPRLAFRRTHTPKSAFSVITILSPPGCQVAVAA
jgi:hypothetical protein